MDAAAEKRRARLKRISSTLMKAIEYDFHYETATVTDMNYKKHDSRLIRSADIFGRGHCVSGSNTVNGRRPAAPD